MRTLKPLVDGIIEQRPAVVVPDRRIAFIEQAVKPIADRKARESRYATDNRDIIGRFGCGLFGEVGIEELLHVVYCDTSVGHTMNYSVPDLRAIGLDIGVKCSDYNKNTVAVVPRPGSANYNKLEPQVVCVKVFNMCVIMGYGSTEVMKKYTSDEYIGNPGMLKWKTGFYGYEHLVPFHTREELERIHRENT